jgi:alkylation response protein AidB-like acyl-CoA dehydrogenase
LREELLAEVDSVAPILAEHARSSEALGRLDDASIEAVRKTRLLRMSVPRDLGGLEVDPVTQLEVIEALARVDAAAAWCVGILSSTTTFAGAHLPAASSRKLFAAGVPAIAGMVAPRGQAAPVAGGYRLKGRWQFGSGINHAEWVLGGGFVQGMDPPAGIRLFVLPKNQVVVHDNWQVAGLKASGSSDYSVEDVFVPEEMTFSFLDTILGKIVTGGAALRLGMPAIVTPFHAGVALGIARRALDEITRQAIEKGRGFPPSPLPTHQHFQMSLGKAELELAAARALEVELLSSLWAEVSAGRTPAPARQAEARAAATFVTEVAQRVTTVAFQAAGGGALFDDNPLQRCFRDVHAAGQHFVMSQTSYRALGQFKLGQPDANPML